MKKGAEVLRGRGVEVRGFTLIELLLAVSLMALLGALMGNLLSNSRRIASATTAVTERFRNEWLLRETIQSEMDVSTSALTLEVGNERVTGFSFTTYSRVRGRMLRARIRYVFDLDPERPVYRLVRYLIADGIGLDETKEILLENVDAPKFEAYSDAAGGFVPIEELTGAAAWIRMSFNLLKIAPRTPDEIKSIPAESIRFMVNNHYGAQSI